MHVVNWKQETCGYGDPEIGLCGQRAFFFGGGGGTALQSRTALKTWWKIEASGKECLEETRLDVDHEILEISHIERTWDLIIPIN